MWLHVVPSSERALNLSPALGCDHSDVQSFTGMEPKKRSQVNDVHFIVCTLTGSAFLGGLLLALVAKRLLLQPYSQQCCHCVRLASSPLANDRRTPRPHGFYLFCNLLLFLQNPSAHRQFSS
ncbi:hypothetical protein P7K49_012444 [Saguinus oedipus]|uniref:Uncharacterized protein n=1 Tax=Saguinus oedipus TaxID=9490 RepID=A0ABQ9VTK6_SAGOE|nr:hypothetical protein P7K49_012444 [Saguinus oedipus]